MASADTLSYEILVMVPNSSNDCKSFEGSTLAFLCIFPLCLCVLILPVYKVLAKYLLIY